MTQPETKNLSQYINQYYETLDEYKEVAATTESTTETAMKSLLNSMAKDNNLVLIKPSIQTQGKTHIYDGVLRRKIDNYDFGYWEAKGKKIDLEKAIKDKIEKGYTKKNILFENTKQAVLYQKGNIVFENNIEQELKLAELIEIFFSYDQGIYDQFNEESKKFQKQIPDLAKTIRETILDKESEEGIFKTSFNRFVRICQKDLNPDIQQTEVRDMFVQHILTEQIFENIVQEKGFLKENSIAKTINGVLDDFYDRENRKELTKNAHSYYQTVAELALQMPDWEEKQRFLNDIYESFFQSYSTKEADRLGVVYTPPEIVNFILESVNEALKKHFGKTVASKNVHILDPCVGTGNFIIHLLDKIAQNDATQLEHKYRHEIHCNEIQLLPYYIASVNIENKFQSIHGRFQEYKGICLADSLDLLEDKNYELFDNLENSQKVETQKTKNIFVIIGNPPYNSKQKSENQANKNKKHTQIDEIIKNTVAKDSTAENKNSLYDSYVKFFTFAKERLQKDGIICFVSNHSFLESIAFDGFRKHLQKDFQEIDCLNLKGNAREGDKTGNVFGIQLGVAITLLIKKSKGSQKETQSIRLRYAESQAQGKEKKLEELKNLKSFQNLENDGKLISLNPNENHHWFSEKLGKGFDKFLKMGNQKEKNTLFEVYSLGLGTNRDALVYDFNKEKLKTKVQKLIAAYNVHLKEYSKLSSQEKKTVNLDHWVDNQNPDLKWSSALKNYLKRGIEIVFDESKIRESMYRPFVKKYLYFDQHLNHRVFQQPRFFPDAEAKNKVICFSGVGQLKPFSAWIVKDLPCLDLIEKTQCFAYWHYRADEKLIPGSDIKNLSKQENITDFGLEEASAFLKSIRLFKNEPRAQNEPRAPNSFINEPRAQAFEAFAFLKSIRLFKNEPRAQKEPRPPDSFINEPRAQKEPRAPRALTKEMLFDYIYAILNHKGYQETYQENLKQELARIPIAKSAEDFYFFAEKGKQLAELHLNYEQVDPYEGLQIQNTKKPIRYEIKQMGWRNKKTEIWYNDTLQIKGIPSKALEYKVGNKSPLEWIVSQFKTWRPADNPHYVIELIKRAVTVSLKSLDLIEEISKKRSLI